MPHDLPLYTSALGQVSREAEGPGRGDGALQRSSSPQPTGPYLGLKVVGSTRGFETKV